MGAGSGRREQFGKRVLVASLLKLGLTLGGWAYAEDVAIPSSLNDRVAGLTAEQRAFLVSDGPLRFDARHDRLFARLERMDAAAVEAYVAAMMRTIEELKFDPERDMAAIPLNTDTPNFNSHRVRRPQEFNPRRDPGPINLNRYLSTRPSDGVLTFLQMPVAMTPEDLIAGGVDVAIVGAPLGGLGTHDGPRAMRMGAMTKGTPMRGGESVATGVSLFDELVVVDYGDIGTDRLSVTRSLDHIREVVREIAETGAIPVIIGGDHTLMYPNAAALTDVYGAGNVAVIHLDAHMDTTPTGVHAVTAGTMIYRLVEEDLVPGRNFIQVGVRGHYDQPRFDWLREQDLRYYTMNAVEKHGWQYVMDRALQDAREGAEYLFISLDVDVIDPTYFPGTRVPEPGGLTSREILPMMRRICAENNVVGFELVELSPSADPGYISVELSDRIVRECLTGIAMRKRGLTEPGYLAPDRIQHDM
ncbi:MAG: agmatinase family protein [Gammaproteobacteria bacterium]|nr:agmatinase family protein [Gammaproteobacteria bacterium]